MNSIKSAIICSALLMYCCGCTGPSGPVYSEHPVPADKSLVYIYREDHTAGSANTFHVFANGHEIAGIGNGGYYDYLADPGHIEFTWLVNSGGINMLQDLFANSGGPHELCTLDAEAGNVYYFRFELAPPKMRQVFKDDAVKAMTGMRRFDDAKPASQ
jgi:hypothetical protein